MIRRMNVHGTQQAFSRLQESEARYQNLIDLMPDALIVFVDYIILYANPSAMELVGVSNDKELIGMSVVKFLLPDRIHDLLPRIGNLLEGMSTVELIREKIIRLDHQVIDIEAKAAVISYDGRQAIQLIIKDVTERKKIENSLVETENLYHSLLENTVAGVFLAHENKIIYANSYLVRVLGYTLEQFLLLRPLEFLVEDELIQIRDRLFKGSKNRKVSFSGKGITKEKQTIYLEGSFTLVTYDGQPAILGTLHDVTFKKEREDELRDTAKMYQRLIKFIPEPIVLTDQGMILYANNSAVKLLGISEEKEWQGKSLFSFMHKDDREVVQKTMEHLLTTDLPTPFVERRLVSKDGQVIDVDMSSIHIRNYMGKVVILTVIRDLTERKKSEELLVRSEKLSLIGQLAAGVGHEIRNPLTALKGFTQLLKSRNGKGDYYYFDIMMNELDRISLIVDEFMTLAKPQLSEFKEVQAEHIIRGVNSLLEAQAIMVGVDIILEFAENVPSILCDENQIKQVFVNLVKNAIEAMPNGGNIVISVEALGDRQVLIAVQDQGVGIPAELLPKIGEPFLTTKDSGTGIGLMVCNRIIEAHHGSLRLTSTLGEGTRVEIVLPSQKI